KPIVVMLSVSGGGARATALAAAVLARIEMNYERNSQLLVEHGEAPLPPLFGTIDVWSTVSGGSIFAMWSAVVNWGIGNPDAWSLSNMLVANTEDSRRR